MQSPDNVDAMLGYEAQNLIAQGVPLLEVAQRLREIGQEERLQAEQAEDLKDPEVRKAYSWPPEWPREPFGPTPEDEAFLSDLYAEHPPQRPAA